jgi:sialate O-acetylesterase
MPEIYSDGMVLQRGRPLEIMGTADAGEKVTVRLAGQKKSPKCAKPTQMRTSRGQNSKMRT